MQLTLPILVILLIAVGVYLTFQKNISNTNKIIIAIISVIILNIAYSYLKKTTEGFTDDNASASYDIEEPSPDFQDSNENENENEKEKEQYNDTPNYSAKRGIAEVVGSINYNDRLTQINNQITLLDSEHHESESFGDIKQSDVKGTGNIFNPQVIIRNDSGNNIPSTTSSYDNGANIPSWQTPVTDLWNSTGDTPPQATPSSYSYQNQTVDKCKDATLLGGYVAKYDSAQRKCNAYAHPPESEGSVEYPYASKTVDKSKVYYPGYSYAPPSNWDIPQKRPPVCIPDKTRLCPTGVFDRGTPTNVLELNPDGSQCMNENECALTNVGSIMPKFEFHEVYDY